MQIEFGYLIKHPRVEGLLPTIKGWRKALTRFADFDGQPGYYFNERTNIGFLAAGAWSAKLAVLEEYVDHKNRDKRRRAGRTDLYISDSEYSAVIEAKQLWTGGYRVPSATFRKKLREAEDDVKSVRHGDAKLACIFLVPHFPVQTYRSNDQLYARAIREFIKSYTSEFSMHLWAWCFPEEMRYQRGSDQYKANFYPGVMLAIKCVKHWPK